MSEPLTDEQIAEKAADRIWLTSLKICTKKYSSNALGMIMKTYNFTGKTLSDFATRNIVKAAIREATQAKDKEIKRLKAKLYSPENHAFWEKILDEKLAREAKEKT